MSTRVTRTANLPDPVEINRLVIESIDETIVGLLGKRVLEAIYRLIKTNYDTTQYQLPDRLEILRSILASVFNAKVTAIIERKIAINLYQRLDLQFHPFPYCGLKEYVRLAKESISDIDQRPLGSMNQRSAEDKAAITVCVQSVAS